MFASYLFVVLIVLIWLLPVLDVYRSNKISQSERILWLFACVFVSWWAWICFYLFAPVFKKDIR